jgi:hypothetical protein
MRLEILVDNEDPQIFPLNKPKLVIGSHESCDIPLMANGISRKHLQILVEDDRYYVVDQGSTNGSYINEERLVPGRRAEFTSFFPVRLGDNVLLTLLSDEEAANLGFAEFAAPEPKPTKSEPQVDATRTISLKDLQSAKTDKLVQRRQETVKKRKVETKAPPKKVNKDKDRMRGVKFAALAIIAAAAYYQFEIRHNQTETPAPQVERPQVQEPPVTPPPKSLFAKVDVSSLTPKSRFEGFANEITCANTVETLLCGVLAERQIINSGALQIGTMVNVLVKGDGYLERAKSLVSIPIPKAGKELTPEQRVRYADDLRYVALILFLKELPDFDTTSLKDLALTFAMRFESQDGPAIVAGAFVPESYLKFRERLKEEKHFQYIPKNGAVAIYFLREYFTYY